MRNLNLHFTLSHNLDSVTCALLGLFLLCALTFAVCVLWVLWKWIDWKWLKWSTGWSLFYRRCRVRYGIVDSKDLASPENR